jgi:hypothetical protein
MCIIYSCVLSTVDCMFSVCFGRLICTPYSYVLSIFNSNVHTNLTKHTDNIQSKVDNTQLYIIHINMTKNIQTTNNQRLRAHSCMMFIVLLLCLYIYIYMCVIQLCALGMFICTLYSCVPSTFDCVLSVCFCQVDNSCIEYI